MKNEMTVFGIMVESILQYALFFIMNGFVIFMMLLVNNSAIKIIVEKAGGSYTSLGGVYEWTNCIFLSLLCSVPIIAVFRMHAHAIKMKRGSYRKNMYKIFNKQIDCYGKNSSKSEIETFYRWRHAFISAIKLKYLNKLANIFWLLFWEFKNRKGVGK